MTRHRWELLEDGTRLEVEDVQDDPDEDWHNGPRCSLCGVAFCDSCEDDVDALDDCRGRPAGADVDGQCRRAGCLKDSILGGWCSDHYPAAVNPADRIRTNKLAAWVRSVPDHLGDDVALYRLDPPGEHGAFVVVSSVTVASLAETLVFPADDAGKIADLEPLASVTGILSPAAALADLGYELV